MVHKKGKYWTWQSNDMVASDMGKYWTWQSSDTAKPPLSGYGCFSERAVIWWTVIWWTERAVIWWAKPSMPVFLDVETRFRWPARVDNGGPTLTEFLNGDRRYLSINKGIQNTHQATTATAKKPLLWIKDHNACPYRNFLQTRGRRWKPSMRKNKAFNVTLRNFNAERRWRNTSSVPWVQSRGERA